MGERKVPFVVGEFYHIYNRGNSKQMIYRSNSDYKRFLQLLSVSNSDIPFKIEYLSRSEKDVIQGKEQVAIGAYCLMPNHFHILLSPLTENGVSVFMKRLATAYSMYFNNKYERTGSLFEGKFKAEWLGEDRLLKYLFAYIHLNPVKLIDPAWREEGIKDAAKAYEHAATFPYSSLSFYSEQESPVPNFRNDILNPSPFPTYFSSSKGIKQELFEWLNYHDVTLS